MELRQLCLNLQRAEDPSARLELAKSSVASEFAVDGKTFALLFNATKEKFLPKLHSLLDEYYEEVDSLYQIYKLEFSKLYSEVSDEKFKELYVLHSIDSF